MKVNRQRWIERLCDALEQTFELSAIEVDALIQFVTGASRVQIVSGTLSTLTHEDAQTIDALVERRARCEPFAYIVGEKEFYGRSFRVNRDVLIPRPETEMLVELVLHELGECAKRTLLIEIGVGSGAPLVSVLAEFLAKGGSNKQLVAVGTDISEAAVRTATENAGRLLPAGVVTFACADLLPESLPVSGIEKVIILSNPPYIEDSYDLPADVRFEPPGALYAGVEGLDIYRRIFPRLKLLLGELSSEVELHGFLEIGHSQGEQVSNLAEENGFSLIRIHNDLAGHSRVVAFSNAPRASRDVSK